MSRSEKKQVGVLPTSTYVGILAGNKGKGKTMTSIAMCLLVVVALGSIAGFAGVIVGLNKDESMDKEMYEAMSEE